MLPIGAITGVIICNNFGLKFNIGGFISITISILIWFFSNCEFEIKRK